MNRKLVALFFRSVFSIAVVAATPSPSLYAEAPAIPNRAPDAIIDLATSAGVGMVAGQWRYRDTRIVQTNFRSPDSDGQPTGAPIQTYDYEPHAGRADF